MTDVSDLYPEAVESVLSDNDNDSYFDKTTDQKCITKKPTLKLTVDYFYLFKAALFKAAFACLIQILGAWTANTVHI